MLTLLAALLLHQGFCPTATQVSEAVGFQVRVFPAGTRSYGPAEMCAYQSTSQSGVMVSVSVQPADPREDPVAEVRSAARTFTGADAERITLGDGGYAYGSKSKSEAATRSGNRVFHAEIQGAGPKKAEVVALLSRVLR